MDYKKDLKLGYYTSNNNFTFYGWSHIKDVEGLPGEEDEMIHTLFVFKYVSFSLPKKLILY